MRRFLILLALAALVCNLALVGPGAASSGDLAYGHVENLVNIGSRFTGTAAEAVAASYIENQLRSYGLQTCVENFSIGNTYVVTENRLSVVAPAQMDITCVPAIYSPSTGGAITGQLEYITSWSPDNIELRNRVVLVKTGEPITELASIPPRAMIYFMEDQPARSAAWPAGLASQCPAVSISGDDAYRLIGLIDNGPVTVELRLTASSPPGISRNVIARLPGDSDETIVVAAHHDSMLTPGAVDDASGVAVMIEIARELSTEKLQRTVMFASFGGEELGLLGSADFVSRHKEDDKLVAAIILDCIAAGEDNGLRIGLSASAQYETTDWLDGYLQEVAENLGFHARAESMEAVRGYSDHVSFTQAGIDASWIYWVNPTSYDILGPVHTLSDNLSGVDNTRLQQTISLGADAVRKLAAEDIEAWRWKYAFPTRVAVFSVAVLGALTISIGFGCFAHYRRDWAWRRAVLVVLVAVVATSSVAGLLLLR